MATQQPQPTPPPSPRDDIIHVPDPRLKRKSARVGHIDHSTETLARHMIAATLDWEETREHEFGAALAAVQLGQNYRVVVIRNDFEDKAEKSFGVFVNPEIVKKSDEKIVVWDACLSFLTIFMQVERHREIVVRYQDLHGEWHEVEAGAERDLSELLQHEIDHLDGILAVDRITDIRTMCTREEFEKRYRARSPYASVGESETAGS